MGQQAMQATPPTAVNFAPTFNMSDAAFQSAHEQHVPDSLERDPEDLFWEQHQMLVRCPRHRTSPSAGRFRATSYEFDGRSLSIYIYI